jgi:hypothetical protein
MKKKIQWDVNKKKKIQPYSETGRNTKKLGYVKNTPSFAKVIAAR